LLVVPGVTWWSAGRLWRAAHVDQRGAGSSGNRRGVVRTTATQRCANPTTPATSHSTTDTVPQFHPVDGVPAGHEPAPRQATATITTRVGRSATVTAPTPGIPTAPARARRYSCTSVSAPA